MNRTYHSLGDQALLVYLPSEAETLSFAETIKAHDFPWLVDLVPAYLSCGIFFDGTVTLADVRGTLEKITFVKTESRITRNHRIPVCYDFDLDILRVSEHTAMSPEEIISNHTSGPYVVYAIGFVPGFPYMGYLPESLTGVPRLPSPRMRVEPGSVGITGRQTGIYPLARPGGWNLIGRTPLELVNLEDDYFPLAVGDTVEFERIDRREFQHLLGERLPSKHVI